MSGIWSNNSKNTDIAHIFEKNQEATIYVGSIDSNIDENLLAELFTQVGRLRSLHIPRDKITGHHQGFGFVEFQNEIDADYALKVLHLVKLYGKPIRLSKASQDKKTNEVGANLFVGNLAEDVDEKTLFDTFSAFGVVLSAKIMRDTETGMSQGYGFVSFDCFESSDAAMTAMNSQFISNRPISVSYAYKKDTRGERHGTAAERLLAANQPIDRMAVTNINNINTQIKTIGDIKKQDINVKLPNLPFNINPSVGITMPTPNLNVNFNI